MAARNMILFFALFAAAAVAGFLFYEYSGPGSPTLVPDDARVSDSRSNEAPTNGHGQAKAGAAPGMRPEFSLPDLDGVQQAISQWDGQALIVNFWATWCPPCRREIPILIEMQDEAAARGIQIIGIAMDDLTAVKTYAQESGFNYPILVGEQEAIDAAEAFGAEVVGLPLTIMTDRDGHVVDIHAGELTRADLVKVIDTLGLPEPL